MRSVQEALDTILNAMKRLSEEHLFLGDAYGYYLSRSLLSSRNLPPFDNSAMDGYGVLAEDIKNATPETPVSLDVVYAVRAGDQTENLPEIKKGQAARIMTGAAIPPGVDAVIMREQTDEKDVSDQGEGTVRILGAVKEAANIRKRGEDVGLDREVGCQGDILSPARMNLLASAGHVVVPVIRKPVVAILASGDELKELGKPYSDADIINSNAYAIAAAVRACGAQPQMIGIAGDTLEEHQKRIEESAFADVLITIGGVSVGTHDFVKPALEAAGAQLSFWKVAMRPGKPLAFGHRKHQVVFGLPGNPVSSQVSFEIFVRPALLQMMGAKHVHHQTLEAEVMGEPFRKRAGVTFFARAELKSEGGQLQVLLHPKQSSGQISGLASGNALAVIPEDKEVLFPGEQVSVIVLEPSHQLRSAGSGFGILKS